MGKKSPHAYQIDPRDSGVTDEKSHPTDPHITAEQKAEYELSHPHDQPMIPRNEANPALRELRRKKGKGRTER